VAGAGRAGGVAAGAEEVSRLRSSDQPR
jgi:hypothetical protein